MQNCISCLLIVSCIVTVILHINSEHMDTEIKNRLKRYLCGPAVVAHACNPSTLGGQSGRIMRPRDQDHSGQHGETLSLLEIQKLVRQDGMYL